MPMCKPQNFGRVASHLDLTPLPQELGIVMQEHLNCYLETKFLERVAKLSEVCLGYEADQWLTQK